MTFREAKRLDKDKTVDPQKRQIPIKANTKANPAWTSALGSSPSLSLQPINDDQRDKLETAFGSDFSGVRVHSDSRADVLNQSVQARAFTTGQDIFFRQGEYQPDSSGSNELLGHELTHVVQQNNKAVSSDKKITDNRRLLQS